MMPPWTSYFMRGGRQFSTAGSHRKPIKQTIGDYWVVKTIGRGVSGTVKLATHKVTGERVAIKIISRKYLTSSTKVTRAVERELAVLQLVHHTNIVELKQVLQDETNVYFVTEYVDGGELFDILAKHRRLSETDAKAIFGQLVAALAWCHANHICHRDLKPENILVDKENKVKIVDFGMATIQSSDALLATSCGSPHYASPEIVAGKSYDGPPADVWSCGVILYVALTGRFPFDDYYIPDLLMKIKTGRYRSLPKYLSPEATDLLQKMLTTDPAARITTHDILSHPWFCESNVSFGDRHTIQESQLHAPVLSASDTMNGRIWKTLTVLWRDRSQRSIFAALTSEGSNVQKLSFRLLEARDKRLVESKNSALSRASTLASSTLDPPSWQSQNESDTCIETNTTQFPNQNISRYSIAQDVYSMNVKSNLPESSGEENTGVTCKHRVTFSDNQYHVPCLVCLEQSNATDPGFQRWIPAGLGSQKIFLTRKPTALKSIKSKTLAPQHVHVLGTMHRSVAQSVSTQLSITTSVASHLLQHITTMPTLGLENTREQSTTNSLTLFDWWQTWDPKRAHRLCDNRSHLMLEEKPMQWHGPFWVWVEQLRTQWTALFAGSPS